MRDKLKDLKKEINEVADAEKAKRDLRFFKTGKGEYDRERFMKGIYL